MRTLTLSVLPTTDAADEQADLDRDLLDDLQTLNSAERMVAFTASGPVRPRHEGVQELIRALRRAGEKRYGVDPRALASPSR
jgi:hypothetical protein